MDDSDDKSLNIGVKKPNVDSFSFFFPPRNPYFLFRNQRNIPTLCSFSFYSGDQTVGPLGFFCFVFSTLFTQSRLFYFDDG